MSAYDYFRSFRQARKAYKRTRTIKWFILKDSNENPDCVVCDKPINDFSGVDEDGKPMHPDGYRNNRCAYLKGQIRPMHYVCMWQSRLEALFNYNRAA